MDDALNSSSNVMASSVDSSSAPSSSGTRRYIVFDGSTDFSLWRARLENELLRFHLLGYIVVKDYDGSQSFVYNNEEIPPKCAMVVDDDDTEDEGPMLQRHGNVYIKDEPLHSGSNNSGNTGSHSNTGRKRARSSQNVRPGRLDRLEVIRERAEAMSILQRYLHPEVERAILGKNIFDSWTTLCDMYGDRSSCDFYMIHRMLHSMELGEKQGESARDFIARLEMMMEQYARITGIQLTDPFRSMILANALPGTWESLLNIWKAFKTYIPYPQLVEKILYEYNRKLLCQENDVVLVQTVIPGKEIAAAKDILPVVAPQERALVIDTTAAVIESTPLQSSRPPSTSSSVTRESPKIVQEVGKPSPRVEVKRHEKYEEKPKEKHGENREGNREDTREDARDHKRDGNQDDNRDYSRRGSNRDYNTKREEREKFNTCYYCLKYGHSFRSCWFLRVDIENDTISDSKKRYSATVTKERSSFMVHKIEQYAEEVRRDRGERPISEIPKSASRSYSQQAAMRSKSSFREESTFSYAKSSHYGQSKERLQSMEPPKAPSQSYSQMASMRSTGSVRDELPHSHVPQQQHRDRAPLPQSQPNGHEPDFDRYRKRSRSAYDGDSESAEKFHPRDPRSRSVFRSTELPTSRDPRSQSMLRD